jgi:hypothetical protein
MRTNAERDTLLNTIFDATDWAKAGLPAIGYDLLLLGQRRAAQGRAAGAPWGKELVNCYRQALDDYERRYDGQEL